MDSFGPCLWLAERCKILYKPLIT